MKPKSSFSTPFSPYVCVCVCVCANERSVADVKHKKKVRQVLPKPQFKDPKTEEVVNQLLEMCEQLNRIRYLNVRPGGVEMCVHLRQTFESRSKYKGTAIKAQMLGNQAAH